LRRALFAKGSGPSLAEGNRLLKPFQEMRKMMKQMGKIAPRPAGSGGLGSMLQ